MMFNSRVSNKDSLENQLSRVDDSVELFNTSFVDCAPRNRPKPTKPKSPKLHPNNGQRNRRPQVTATSLSLSLITVSTARTQTLKTPPSSLIRNIHYAATTIAKRKIQTPQAGKESHQARCRRRCSNSTFGSPIVRCRCCF